MFQRFLTGLGALTRYVSAAVGEAWSVVKTALTYTEVTGETAPKELTDIYAQTVQAKERISALYTLSDHDMIPENFFAQTKLRYQQPYVYQYKTNLVYTDGSIEFDTWKQISADRRLSKAELDYYIGEQVYASASFVNVDEYEITDYMFYHRAE